MEFDKLKRTVQTTRLQRNVMGGGFALMLAVNGLLAFEIHTQSNQVILVPTNVVDGMVAPVALCALERELGFLRPPCSGAAQGRC